MPKKRKISGSKHESPETRVAQIVSAAKICLEKEGYAATSIDKIANRARLSKGTIYRFFDSKDSIVDAILDAIGAEYAQTYEVILAENQPSLERIRKVLRASFELGLKHSELNRVWLEAYSQKQLRSRIKSVYSHIRELTLDLIEAGIADGGIRAEAPEALAELTIVLNEGLLVLYTIEEEPEPLERFDRLWPVVSAAYSKHPPE